MRTIKFRGRFKRTKEWIYGSLVEFNRVAFIRQNDTKTHFEQGLSQVAAYTIGQFTGLHDKNGKEIYEGDIVNSKFTTYIVKWNKEGAYFSLKEDNTPHLLADYVEDIEIIGNTYDNPELLKQQEL